MCGEVRITLYFCRDWYSSGKTAALRLYCTAARRFRFVRGRGVELGQCNLRKCERYELAKVCGDLLASFQLGGSSTRGYFRRGNCENKYGCLESHMWLLQ